MNKSAWVTAAATVTIVIVVAVQSMELLKALAQQDKACRTFPETGRTVCGRFLEYWRQNGGLAQFGYPISNEFRERSKQNSQVYVVQYFERAVYEMHPENKRPFDVLLSQLGTLQFRCQYPNGSAEGSYPLYPNNQNLKTKRDGNEITTTFETGDSTEVVLRYYRGALPKAGWQLIEEKQNTLRFGYRPSSTVLYPGEQPCPNNPSDVPKLAVFTSYVAVTAGTGVKTNVEITLIEEMTPDVPPQ